MVYAQLISQHVMDVLRDTDPGPMIRLLNGGWEAWPLVGKCEALNFPDASGYLSGNQIISVSTKYSI